jgi:hypothetical protein
VRIRHGPGLAHGGGHLPHEFGTQPCPGGNSDDRAIPLGDPLDRIPDNVINA